MNPDELRARVGQFIDDEEIDLIADMPGDAGAPTLRANLESLCREMIAVGLERATEGLKIDNTKLRWALKELGPTDLRCEAYVRVAVEQVIWAREEAQRVKNGEGPLAG